MTDYETELVLVIIGLTSDDIDDWYIIMPPGVNIFCSISLVTGFDRVTVGLLSNAHFNGRYAPSISPDIISHIP